MPSGAFFVADGRSGDQEIQEIRRFKRTKARNFSWEVLENIESKFPPDLVVLLISFF